MVDELVSSSNNFFLCGLSGLVVSRQPEDLSTHKGDRPSQGFKSCASVSVLQGQLLN